MSSKKVKAIVLFSGGLDSNLAIKILEAQGIDVTAFCFASNFFGAKNAKIGEEKNNIKLKVIDISKDILELVKNPPHGHGKNMNPCIDCHALMMKKAKEYLKDRGGDYNFIASGEVLGQRPFSQNKESLKEVKKTADVDVLRPLSAKLLEETEAEKKGLVDRSRLEDIDGRRRERQTELAKKYKLKYYPSPGGGCLLTDIVFSKRLKELIEKNPDCTPKDVEILKYGRVFWLGENQDILVVVGRHKEDNENLSKLAQKGDFMVELKEMTGPVSLARIFNFQLSIFNKNGSLKFKIPEKLDLNEIKKEKDVLKAICTLTGYYATKARGKEVEFEIKRI